MNIGLGGGAASSMASGQSAENLDFASVQRENPEMERRCQEVIDRCWQLGAKTTQFYLSTMSVLVVCQMRFPELVSDGGRGGNFELRNVYQTMNVAWHHTKSGVMNRRNVMY